MNKLRMWNGGGWGPGTPRKITAESTWRAPLKWNDDARLGVHGKDVKHNLVFAGDLCDIFDDEGPVEARERMWEVFRATSNLTWQVLTKRPENFARFLPSDWGDGGYANVWLGVTAENRKEADRRIGILRETPARLRFVSFEPLLEALGSLNLEGIHWAIVGGESGAKARTFEINWARSIQEQCENTNTAFFMKQLGRRPTENGSCYRMRYLKEEGKLDTNGTLMVNFPSDLRVQNWPALP